MDNLNEWRVCVPNKDMEDVVIEPPVEIDREFDDLWLRVTGNMLKEDKIRIAQIVCDKLNNKVDEG